MTQKSRSTWTTDMEALLATTGAQGISAADVRAVLGDLEDSVLWYDEGPSTNLTWNASTRTLSSSTGTNAVISLADGTNAGLMSSAHYTKVEGIEVGATADQTAQEIATLIDADTTAENTLKTALSVPTSPGDIGAAAAGHSHTLADITDSGAAASKGVTGVDANAVTGTAGVNGNLAAWNVDGDVVDAGSSTSDFAPASHTHPASAISSGTFADARIAQTNVTQHEAALTIAESQISDLGAYITTAGVTFEALNGNADVGTGANQVAAGDHGHTLAAISDSGAAAGKGVTGADATVVTGTAGISGRFLSWDVNGDAVDSGNSASDFASASHAHSAGDINSGTFADARIAQSNVTQHEAALSIAWSQVTGAPSFATTGDITYETLNANGDVGTGGLQVAAGNHTHTTGDISGLGAAATKGVTGADFNAVTGTSGNADTIPMWNADGDLVGTVYTFTSFVQSGTLGSQADHDQTVSTSAPSGGSDGDVWYQV